MSTMMSDLQEDNAEPLVEIPMEKWEDIQNAFKLDWPRGVSGYALLDAQRELIEKGFGYGFKVFCPFGRTSNGMVAFNEKKTFYEIVVQCPTEDTRELEEALKRTKLIDWKNNIVIPYAPSHVLDCIKRIIKISENVEIKRISPVESFILQINNLNNETYKGLPSDITFGLLSAEHADTVNNYWPHKYPSSLWFFQLLINAKRGYGLFRNHQLISWLFINEAGFLAHMFTIEDERRKGYAEILLRIVSNNLLRDGRNVFAFCVRGNISACNLHRKVGFTQYDFGVSWCYLEPKAG